MLSPNDLLDFDRTSRKAQSQEGGKLQTMALIGCEVSSYQARPHIATLEGHSYIVDLKMFNACTRAAVLAAMVEADC